MIHRLILSIGFLFLCLSPACKVVAPSGIGAPSPVAVKVFRIRWLKRMAPAIPNFLFPEMQEEHDRFHPVAHSSAAFDTDKRRVFIGSPVGGLYCLDVRTGRTVWRFQTDDAVGSVPLYDSDRKFVYFGADNGGFYALHARSGRQIWRVETGSHVRREPLLYNDTLYVVSADNTVFALDPDSGQIVWQYRRPPLKGFSAAGHAGLLLYGGKLITGFSDGYLVAFDPTVGAVLWSQDLAAELDEVTEDGMVKLTDSDATPVVAGGVLVAASVDGGLRGLDAVTGTMIWTNPEMTNVTGLAVYDGTVYAARTAFGLSAVAPESGKEIWSRRFRSGMLADPVVYDDLLLISDAEFGLYAVSALDGRLLQQIDNHNGFFARPSIHAGYLLVLGNGGMLYAMSIL